MNRFKSATEFAMEEIKSWILSGVLRPNQKVDQADLAAKLELSRLPVRQALDRLSEQGFVRVLPHRGAVVAPLSHDDMIALYALRSRLEDWALEEAFAKYDGDTILALERHIDEAEAAVAAEDLARYMAVNRRFHLAIFAPAGNPYLQRAITTLYDLSERYQRASLSKPGRMRESNADHREMIDAIRKKDRERFLSLTARHNGKTQQTLLAMFGEDAA